MPTLTEAVAQLDPAQRIIVVQLVTLIEKQGAMIDLLHEQLGTLKTLDELTAERLGLLEQLLRELVGMLDPGSHSRRAGGEQ